MRRVTVGLLVATSLVVPQAATARAMKLHRVAGGAQTVVADGRHSLATWSGAGAITIRDVVTNSASSLPSPDPCSLVGFAPDRNLLLDCPANSGFSTGVTYDPTTRTAKTLTVTGPGDGVQYNDDSAHFTGLGTYWASVVFRGYHYSTSGFVNRVNGAVVRENDPSLHASYPDLNLPSLGRPLCSAIRRPSIPNDDFVGVEAGPLALFGRYAASTTYTDSPGVMPSKVVLQHCGAPQRVLERCVAVTCSQPIINSRIVAWIDSSISSDKATLRVYSLATRKSRTLRISSTTDPDPTLRLIAHRLFVVSDERLARVLNSGA